MTDDRHARVCRGRDAIAEVLVSHCLPPDVALERANNLAQALGGCQPGDEIAEAVKSALDAVTTNTTATRRVALHVLAAWVETERGGDHG